MTQIRLDIGRNLSLPFEAAILGALKVITRFYEGITKGAGEKARLSASSKLDQYVL
jgi:hypothetical protein